MNWVDVLNFPSSEDWKTASRKAIKVEEIVEGYYKKLGNLAVYWVDRAGHMVYFKINIRKSIIFFLRYLPIIQLL